jgi:hypothetical protein
MMRDFRFMIDDFRLKAGAGINRQSSIVNRKFLIAAALLVLGLLAVSAQEERELPRTESRFTMGRVFFESPMASLFMGAGPPWSHDWPRSEEHFMKIMAEVTKLDVNPGGHIISFQNDECFKYPIAYLCEVGYLDLSKEEARRMAEYLLRGGFLIVDDFRGEREFRNFRSQMKQVFPNRSLEELSRSHQIWTCFYDISKLSLEPPYLEFLTPQYYGISDDNGRLMMVVNYNNDISEYWEWSGDPIMPIDESNEAYKYGVNYVMYALTH